MVHARSPAASASRRDVSAPIAGSMSLEVVGFCERKEFLFGLTADQRGPLLTKITGLAEAQWEDLERYGVAQVAEVRYQPVG